MSRAKKFDLQGSEDDEDVAYLKLPGHPGALPGVVKKSIRLRDLLGDYSGPDLHFEFDEDNMLIGVEIVG